MQYIIETEQTNPSQVASLAKQLVQTDNVGAMVGDFSIFDCTVNHAYYEAQGLNVIDSGVAAECYTTAHSAAVTDFLAQSLGSAWNGKLFVNAELALYTSTGADNTLYRQVRAQYAPNTKLGSYGQMGFLEAKIATDRMLSITGPITKVSVNQALGATKDYQTDLVCKPWYYGTAALHIPNNTDWTVTPQNGHMVEVQGCTGISAADPDIAKVRAIEKSTGI